MMIFINEAYKEETLTREVWEPFVLILAPYAPHLAEELWEKLNKTPSLSNHPYPDWIEELTKDDEVTVVFQVNGKLRAKMELPVGTPEEDTQRKSPFKSKGQGIHRRERPS